MKKILFIVSVIALAIPLMVGTSFGAAIGASTNTDNIETSGNPQCLISLSKNVSFGYTPNSASNAQSYAIQAYHTSGNKAYGSASDTTLMYWLTDTTSEAVGEPAVSDSSMFDSSSDWTAM